MRLLLRDPLPWDTPTTTVHAQKDMCRSGILTPRVRIMGSGRRWSISAEVYISNRFVLNLLRRELSTHSVSTIRNTGNKYLMESKIKDTTEYDKSASYQQIDDFNFATVDFFFYAYVIMYHFHLFMVCIPADSMRKCMFCVWKLFKAIQTTDKKVDVARLKWISFKVIISQIQMWLWLPVCDYNLWLAQILSLYNDLDRHYKLSITHMLNDLFHTLC
jgi:hypothetical protein